MADSKSLPECIMIDNITECKNFFMGLDYSKDIIIDLSHIQKITTPGFQLFIASYNKAKASGNKFIIKEPSENFISVAKILGLGDLIKEWGNNV